MKLSRGFTLIELLVVISIIALLSSVVIASLSSARSKARSAAVSSSLSNMIVAAEMEHDVTGNYSTACSAGSQILASITGATTAKLCYSHYFPGLSDRNSRWGASVIDYSATPPLRAWSVSQSGQVTWDAKGVDTSGNFINSDMSMTWDQAFTACAMSGGRLPTIEELYTLYQASWTKGPNYPPGFVMGNYWSLTAPPSNNSYAYYILLPTDVISYTDKSTTYYVRCVR